MKRLVLVVAACLGILPLLHVSVALAHTIDAPASVLAQPDGSFEYRFVFIAGSPTELAGSGWDGIASVLGGLHGDCFSLGFRSGRSAKGRPRPT